MTVLNKLLALDPGDEVFVRWMFKGGMGCGQEKEFRGIVKEHQKHSTAIRGNKGVTLYLPHIESAILEVR